MKKIVFIMLAVLLVSVGVSFAVTTALVPTTTHDVGDNGQTQMYVYESTTTVGTAFDQRFKIDTPQVYGNIKQISFESAIDNATVWISQSDNQTRSSVQTIDYSAAVDLIYRSGTVLEYFRNRDTVQDKYLYFTIHNGATDNASSGSWNLDITYGK